MSNGILVDLPEEGNDVNNQIEKELDEIATEAPQVEDKPDFAMPDKFQGKSAEEIAKSYMELESYKGELTNQLGDYRTMTDRLLDLEEKRSTDLEKGGAEEFEIDPTDLLANPKEVMDRYYEQRKAEDSAYTELQARLDRIEGDTREQQFSAKHTDAGVITNDPRFLEWIQANPVRQNIAATAVQNQDYDSLDYLLSDWKERSPAQAETQTSNRKANELKAAAQVTTESSSSGTPAKSGKVYSRRKMIELKLNDPDEYRLRAAEFTAAYTEGRVTD